MNLLEDFKIIRPVEHDARNYEEARRTVVETFKGINEVSSIYEFGKLNNPGISDLDLIFAFRENISNKNIGLIFESLKLPQWIESLLCGSTLMVFKETDFERVLIWDDLTVNRLYGNEIILEDIGDDRYIRNIAQIMDWLPERLLSLQRLLELKEIPIIRCLGLLHSLNYSLKKSIEIGIINKKNTKAFEEHFEKVKNIRENFFLASDEEVKIIIADLLYNSFKLGKDAIEKANHWLSIENNYYSSSNDPCGIFLLSENHGFIIDDDIERREKDLVKIKNMNLVGVPNIWGVHWKFYSNGDHFLQENIKKGFTDITKINGLINLELENILLKRIELCNSMASFLKENSFSKGLFKMGWFYK